MERALSKSLRRRVVAEAKRDAVLFVEEFGTPLDPAATDWDGTAWEVADVRSDAEDAGALDAAWEVYSAALVAETKRLVRGFTPEQVGRIAAGMYLHGKAEQKRAQSKGD